MIKTQVIDNFLNDKELLNSFYSNEILKGKIHLAFHNAGYAGDIPHSFTSSKNEEDFNEIYIIQKLHNKITDYFSLQKPLHRWHLNVYPSGYDGSIHVDYNKDSNLPTFLYLATPSWEKRWGGEFILYDTKLEANQVVSCVEDRLIVFDGSLPHRAVGPTRLTSLLRTTIAFQY